MVASEEPTLTVVVWRKLCAILKAWRSAGDIPGMLVVFIPRLTVSYMVVTVAQMARAIARLVGTSSSYEPKANLRILIITDYMPPQTHGYAASPLPPAPPAPPRHLPAACARLRASCSLSVAARRAPQHRHPLPQLHRQHAAARP